ncbi:hypothetical protein RirG_211840 [Rhizophagus irregularis DAOM 197198w]|uniref:Uncharacterized protein n=1 Tax=Rhizophagus irregularis (strain DAOM 197198w) TaxID=1432141 RepID=A0A015LQC7_RHIIW|nr:hypothetical protein RirG_211840 [Rhizophagus irregularis DAOM 197198w]
MGHKKKILKDFQVANLFEGQEATRGQNIEKIWREFYRLYKIMHQKSITNEEINQFEVNGSMIFAGTVNSANQQQGMYLRTEVHHICMYLFNMYLSLCEI